MNIQAFIHQVLKSGASSIEKEALLNAAFNPNYESSIADSDPDVQQGRPDEIVGVSAQNQDSAPRQLLTAKEVSERIGYSPNNLILWYRKRPDLLYREKSAKDPNHYLYDIDSVLKFMEATGRYPRQRKNAPYKRRHANIASMRRSPDFIINGGSSKTHSNIEIRDWYNLSQVDQIIKARSSDIERVEHLLDVYQISDMKIVNIRQVQAALRGERLQVDKTVWRRWGLQRHIAEVYNISHQQLGRMRDQGELAYHYISKGRCVLCIPEVEQKLVGQTNLL